MLYSISQSSLPTQRDCQLTTNSPDFSLTKQSNILTILLFTTYYLCVTRARHYNNLLLIYYYYVITTYLTIFSEFRLIHA